MEVMLLPSVEERTPDASEKTEETVKDLATDISPL